MPLPLEGVLVIALEQAVAAPFCTSRLADAGARVIKIERSLRIHKVYPMDFGQARLMIIRISVISLGMTMMLYLGILLLIMLIIFDSSFPTGH